MKRAIILAAGKGTRMNSDIPKVLHKVQSVELINHVINNVKAAGIDEIWVCLGYGSDAVKAALPIDINVFYQSEQLGTANAVASAYDQLANKKGKTLIICGDTPLISSETIKRLFEYDNAVLTCTMENPGSYGRVICVSENVIKKIVEQKDCDKSELLVKLVNTGTYCFNNNLLFEFIGKIGNKNSQNEYYLTDILEIFNNEGHKVKSVETIVEESIGINDKVVLAEVEQIMKKQVINKHLESGVTIVDVQSTYIENSVKIGNNVKIHPNVVLMGKTTIGDGCEIYPFTHVEDSVIEGESAIGPFARIREETVVGKRAKIGNFVEVKKSTIGENTKAGHLAYIGDATLGKNVNVGAGVVFANYDGKNKNKTNVGDCSFIGSNSTLIAPLNVGEKSFVAGGSTITKNVPDLTLAIARAKQEVR